MIALLFFGGSAHGLTPDLGIDQYVHEQWGLKDGLPEGAVLAIHQTRDGYLWIGTQSHLVRFDGRRFHIFEENRLGLKQYSFVRDLMEDDQGVLFAAAVGGLARFDGKRFQFFDNESGLEHPFVYALAPDASNTLHVGTGGTGVWRFDSHEFTLHPAYHKEMLPGKVNDLLIGPHGALWVATDLGILILGKKERHITTAEGLPSPMINRLLSTKEGRVFAGTQAGLVEISSDAVTALSTSVVLADEDITALLEDRDGIIWAGTRDGVLNRIFEGCISNVRRENRGIFALHEDREGSLWVGTGEGLERYREGAIVTIGKTEGLDDERLLNILSLRNGAIAVLDSAGAIRQLKNNTWETLAEKGSIYGDGVLGLAQDTDGSIWIGGESLHRLKGGRIETYEHPGGEFTVLSTDESGLLTTQTATNGESRLLLFENGSFSPLSYSLPLLHVQRIFRDKQRRLWISTGGEGVVRIDRGEVTRFRKSDGLPHDIVYDFFQDDGDRIWVTTRSGLARIDGDSVVDLSHVANLPTRSPVHLLHDDFGYLYITADDGIFRVGIEDLNGAADGIDEDVKVRRFASRDGLGGAIVSWRPQGTAQSRDGVLWFATNRGLARLDPMTVTPKKTPRRVIIEAVSIDGHEIAADAASIVALRGERIDFRFTAPALVAADELEFRYRLVGFDDKWGDGDALRTATYTNLPAGDYRFQVTVRRPGGKWRLNGAAVSLRIPPLWYETMTAKILFASAIILILLGIYQLRVRHLKQRERILVRTVEERTESLRVLNEQLEERVADRTVQLRDVMVALADEKEKLAVTLRSIGEGVATTGKDGRIAMMNPAAERIMGLSIQEAFGFTVSQAFALLNRRTREEISLSILDGPEIVAPMDFNRVILKKRAGMEILVDVSIAPVQVREKGFGGVVIVLRDVTEKTRVEEQLQKTQKLEALGILAGGIAHDFNNLLTGIFCRVDLAKLKLDPRQPATQILGESLDVLENAKHLTRQLLTFTAGGGLSKKSHSLQELLQLSSDFVLAGSRVSAMLHIPEDLWPCDVDLGQIRQVFDNLVINARQAMPKGGAITISAENVHLDVDADSDAEPGDYVAITLEDNGPGIPDDIKDKIFDPFFTTKSTGTGLGLATVRNIVTQHGGDVEVTSSNRGTAFRILLRRAKAPPVSSMVKSWKKPIKPGSAKVLVMDDEAQIRRLAKRALEHSGYRVAVTANGAETVSLIKRSQKSGEPFDVVILDLTVPDGLGGLETIKMLKSQWPEIRAIASSGYPQDPVMISPEQHGFNTTLEKPYTLNALLSSIEETVSS